MDYQIDEYVCLSKRKYHLIFVILFWIIVSPPGKAPKQYMYKYIWSFLKMEMVHALHNIESGIQIRQKLVVIIKGGDEEKYHK